MKRMFRSHPRHRWGRAQSMRWSSVLERIQVSPRRGAYGGVWCQVCIECFLRRLIRVPSRRYDVMDNLDTRGAWTIATAPASQSGYRPARRVGPCPRRTS